MAERNLIQKMFGVGSDGVSAQTKAGIQSATGEAPPPPPVATGVPISGSTNDPNATVALPDGRRITPSQAAILEQMLRQRQAKTRTTVGR